MPPRTSRLAPLAALAVAASAAVPSLGRADPPLPHFTGHGDLVAAFTVHGTRWDVRVRDLTAQRDILLPANVNSTTFDEINPALSDDGSRLALQRSLPGGRTRTIVVDLRRSAIITPSTCSMPGLPGSARWPSARTAPGSP